MNLHYIGERDKTSDKTKEGNIFLNVADCHDCEFENIIRFVKENIRKIIIQYSLDFRLVHQKSKVISA